MALAGVAGLMALSACASPAPRQPSPAVARPRGEAALPVMERVALAARDCWFRGRDPAFRAFRLAPELNSHSGRPRILVVPAANPGGLPLLVVEGRGSPARLETFGPLLQTGEGARIARDVDRWASGNRTCGTS